MLQESLSEEERDDLGKIHPHLMGGEYLPDLEPGEVEIARIEMQSVTADVMSIRARPDGEGGIRYRIVDEYDFLSYDFSPKHTEKPLSMGELIHLIDHTSVYEEGAKERVYQGLVSGLRAWKWGTGYREPRPRAGIEGGPMDPNEYARFADASSNYYPELHDYYVREAQAWAERIKRKRRQ
jgi:hypothetical protein